MVEIYEAPKKSDELLPSADDVDDVLRELYTIKYGEGIHDTFVLAERLGLDPHVCLDFEIRLEALLHSRLGVVNEVSLSCLCPQCLRAFDDKGETALFRDVSNEEVVCRLCGFVVSSIDDCGELDDSKPFGEEWKPSSAMAINGSNGGTLNTWDFKKQAFTGDKGLATVLGGSSSLSYVDFKVFELEHPDLATRLTDPAKPATYIIANQVVYKLRVYSRGPQKGLKMIVKVALRDFEDYGDMAFDCMKVRGQRMNSMLNAELPGQDQLLLMGTELASRYGIAFSPSDTVFLNTFGVNIRKAFSLCKDWGYAVKNRTLVHTMFYLTLNQFHYEKLLARCKDELNLDNGLCEFVKQISIFIKTLQATE